jgi:DNA replication protein DnaC
MCLDTYKGEIAAIVEDFIRELTLEFSGKKYYGLFLTGESGCGKTHYCVALMHTLAVEHGIEVRYENAGSLLTRLRDYYSEKKDEEDFSEQAFIKYLVNVPVLLLDDIGVERVTDWVRDKIYEIVDGRFTRYKPTLYTSNVNANDLSRSLSDRITSRMCGMSLQVAVRGKDRRNAT